MNDCCNKDSQDDNQCKGHCHNVARHQSGQVEPTWGMGVLCRYLPHAGWVTIIMTDFPAIKVRKEGTLTTRQWLDSDSGLGCVGAVRLHQHTWIFSALRW